MTPQEPQVGAVTIFPPGSVLLAYRQCIREYESSRLKGLFVSGSTYIMVEAFRRRFNGPGSTPFRFQSAVDGFFHCIPYFSEVIPDIFILALFHIFPVTFPVRSHHSRISVILFIPYTSRDFQLSDCCCFQLVRLRRYYKLSSSPESCCLRRKRQMSFRSGGKEGKTFGCQMISYRGGSFECVYNGYIRHVPFSGSGETSIECYFERGCIRMTFYEHFCSFAWTHCVTSWKDQYRSDIAL